MPVGYPGSGVTITVEALLKQPRLLARRLTDLVYQRFIADRIFAQGTADQVAGGAALYQRSESIFPTGAAEEVGVRSEYPRTAWTEAVLAAIVRKYGLEVPIADEAQRRNAMDVIARAQRKLANAVVKFVDTQAMTLLTTDSAVLTGAASGDWTTAATDIISDIAGARKAIFDQNEGYDPDTIIVNPAQELDLITDVDIRNALPREGSAPQPAALTGRAVPILGLTQVLSTPQLSAGTVIILSSGVAGTIADEAPLAGEGYATYRPGGPAPGAAPFPAVSGNPGAAVFPTIYVKVYREDSSDESIVRAARFPAMWLSEPKSVYKLTGA